MREICLDEGILQSYLDGELSLAMTEQVAGHIASCAPCAAMVREAEGELAIFNTAFVAEMALPIPSEQLRVRINQAVDALETAAAAPPPQGFKQKADAGWRVWLGTLAAAFTPQRAAGFASIIALITFGLIFSAVYKRNSGPAVVNEERPSPAVAVNRASGPVESGGAATVSATNPTPTVTIASTSTVEKHGRRNNTSNAVARYASVNSKSQGETARANLPSTANVTPPVQPSMAELPGEKSYLKTIASLSTAIDASNSLTMQPTLRAEYERNLALVDQAISATRPVALSKPGDPSAAQFLYSAYQSKIDLLSAIADRQSEAIARR
jgi:anti-sigma factor RsiW